jgi:hypothetical protein
MAFELGPLVEAQEAVVRPRSLTGQGDLTAADQADISEGVVRRATGPDGDEGGVAASQPAPRWTPSSHSAPFFWGDDGSARSAPHGRH